MQTSQEELLTARELDVRLKVSTAAIRRWTLDGMPVRRLGGRLVRFEISSALRWLELKRTAAEMHALRPD